MAILLRGVWLNFLFVLLFTFNAYASDWDTKDTLLQTTYSIIHVIDWMQTRQIAKNPDKYYETNIILGKYPSVDKVNIYFASTLISQATISYLIPKKYRNYWQYIWIAHDIGYVVHNFNIGIKGDW